MTKQRDLREEAARGHRAESEWREMEAAYEALQAAIVRELVGTSPANPEKVLKLHMAAQNLTGVKEALMRTIANGKHAGAQFAAEQALAESGLTRP